MTTLRREHAFTIRSRALIGTTQSVHRIRLVSRRSSSLSWTSTSALWQLLNPQAAPHDRLADRLGAFADAMDL